MDRTSCNAFRYTASRRGHYESYFQRANHPTEPLAFWIRYTVFSPKGRPRDAVGELWAIVFDGRSGEIVPVKSVVPIADVHASARGLEMRVGEATLDGASLRGGCSGQGHVVRWDLRFTNPEPPLLLLPEPLYDAPLPKAKALVGSPLAVFDGTIEVDGRTIPIERWVGSQNHNWGEKHTDEYAWGQVAGFDDAPDSFLELSTARVHLGPIKSPWMSPIVLRHEGREHRLNAIATTIRAKARYDFFRWSFASEADGVAIRGTISAAPQAFVGLRYDNPPGGRKTCLNSKLAQCRITLERRGEEPVLLFTKNRAAFEILTARTDHGVPILAS